ncbi:hypothetical protein F442_14840 [Phytophthora nicotianae P10297]|uniref:Uncharacterized protein n=1 Tax=Phytophthora nicotianae P10297 TaxID=1317064 RepID=W2YTV0_PHYNI|nr:hypothetical protein F442_14840 [Phytophthora nicotianae P10297]
MLDPSGASKDIPSFVRYLEYCCSCDPETGDSSSGCVRGEARTLACLASA